jgi:hypothetical protein
MILCLPAWPRKSTLCLALQCPLPRTLHCKENLPHIGRRCETQSSIRVNEGEPNSPFLSIGCKRRFLAFTQPEYRVPYQCPVNRVSES